MDRRKIGVSQNKLIYGRAMLAPTEDESVKTDEADISYYGITSYSITHMLRIMQNIRRGGHCQPDSDQPHIREKEDPQRVFFQSVQLLPK